MQPPPWSRLISLQGHSAWLGTCWVHRPLDPRLVVWCFARHFPTRNTGSSLRNTPSSKCWPAILAWWIWSSSWILTPNRRLIFCLELIHRLSFRCPYISPKLMTLNPGTDPWPCLLLRKLGPAWPKTSCIHGPHSCTGGHDPGLALEGLVPCQVAQEYQWGKAVVIETHGSSGGHEPHFIAQCYWHSDSGGTKVQSSGVWCSPKTAPVGCWIFLWLW